MEDDSVHRQTGEIPPDQIKGVVSGHGTHPLPAGPGVELPDMDALGVARAT